MYIVYLVLIISLFSTSFCYDCTTLGPYGFYSDLETQIIDNNKFKCIFRYYKGWDAPDRKYDPGTAFLLEKVKISRYHADDSAARECSRLCYNYNRDRISVIDNNSKCMSWSYFRDDARNKYCYLYSWKIVPLMLNDTCNAQTRCGEFKCSDKNEWESLGYIDTYNGPVNSPSNPKYACLIEPYVASPELPYSPTPTLQMTSSPTQNSMVENTKTISTPVIISIIVTIMLFIFCTGCYCIIRSDDDTKQDIIGENNNLISNYFSNNKPHLVSQQYK
jgi:hypothetical protein